MIRLGDDMIAGVYRVHIFGLGLLPKSGKVILRTIDNRLSGAIEVFGKTHSFSSGTYQNDRIDIDGYLYLPTGKKYYSGGGSVTGNKIDLTLDTESGRITIRGKKVTKQENS